MKTCTVAYKGFTKSSNKGLMADNGFQEGFIDTTTYVYAMTEDGEKGALLRTHSLKESLEQGPNFWNPYDSMDKARSKRVKEKKEKQLQLH